MSFGYIAPCLNNTPKVTCQAYSVPLCQHFPLASSWFWVVLVYFLLLCFGVLHKQPITKTILYHLIDCAHLVQWYTSINTTPYVYKIRYISFNLGFVTYSSHFHWCNMRTTLGTHWSFHVFHIVWIVSCNKQVGCNASILASIL